MESMEPMFTSDVHTREDVIRLKEEIAKLKEENCILRLKLGSLNLTMSQRDAQRYTYGNALIEIATNGVAKADALIAARALEWDYEDVVDGELDTACAAYIKTLLDTEQCAMSHLDAHRATAVLDEFYRKESND